MNKDVLILMAGRFLQALLTFAALRVMTAFLSPAQVGNIYLILSFAAGFGLFLINPVGMYINRRLHSWQADKSVLEHFSRFNLYVFSVSLLAVAVVLGARNVLGVGAGLETLPFIFIVAAYVYSSTWNMTSVPALNMLGYRSLFVIFSVLTTAIGLAFSTFLVIHSSPSAFSWMTGQSAAMFLLAFFALWALKNRTGERLPSLAVLREKMAPSGFGSLGAFALPLSGATLFMWLQNQSYRLIVEREAGAEFLGYLAVGLGIASSLAAVTESLVQQIYFPGFYKRLSGDAQERRTALAELAEKAIPVYILLAAFTVSLSSQLTGLLVDEKFRSAAYFVMFGAFVEFCRMSANILSASAHSEMKTSVLIKPYAIGGIFTCVAVYAACSFSSRETLVPLAMVLGGLITLLAMRSAMSRLISLELDHSLIWKTLGLACVFLVFLAARKLMSPLWAVVILSAAGGYFLLAVYLVTFRLGKSNVSDFLKDIVGGYFESQPT